jgi:hypothetical protein
VHDKMPPWVKSIQRILRPLPVFAQKGCGGQVAQDAMMEKTRINDEVIDAGLMKEGYN